MTTNAADTAAPDTLLHALFQAALGAVVADTRLPAALPEPPKGRTVVIGAGKAAAAMAKVVENHWPGPLTGLVVTRYDHDLPTERIEVVQASHPVPDAAGEDAAKRILAMVQGLTADDLVLCLISGGGSALLALPAPGVSLDDKRAVAKALLKSGADIAEMNCVRKHLSAIKGGRLAAAAHPARVVSLLVSDVPGDDPSVIASGPTVPDPTSFADARAILAKYGITPPPGVAAHLERGEDETPKPGDPRLAGAVTSIIATPQDALDAAAAVARERGYAPVVLGDLEGEARDVAKVHAGIARQIARHGQPAPAPAVLLSGGETTVTVRGSGRGGRNVEFLLALAVALDGHPGIHAAAFDTDGIDGTEDNAGALLRPDTLARAAALGLDAKAHLANNDGYGFFQALGDLVVTGPTRTNVNDFRVIVVDRAAGNPAS
ncbi:hydroxypyruvate reductase [Azospirillum agricola]|uniref:glycerate kinase type-2 family protein n=1 Tax=Azospirillum agricola TaxID=1720247 RepID=UPI001AE8518A|nr:glycerate kinase [Azospirillum agricola]MBP2228789.1 hydroxypyruvate reductase [Azospirillum agricola]